METAPNRPSQTSLYVILWILSYNNIVFIKHVLERISMYNKQQHLNVEIQLIWNSQWVFFPYERR